MRSKDDQLQHWLRKLTDPLWDARWTAAIMLGNLNDQRAIAPLMHALADKHWTVRWEVTETLGKIGDARIVPTLIAILLGKPTYLRINAAWILGKLKDRQAVEPLIQALADPNWFGRAKAAWALGEIGDWRAIPPLQKALDDLETSVQDAAEMAIKTMYAAVKTVLFGVGNFPVPILWPAWPNPEPTELIMPLSELKTIGIQTDTYDFHLVERFLTYAINSIGQKHLKQSVEVHIYGDPAKLHPNLRNNFQHLCKGIAEYKLQAG